jgi:hypothetical protein
LVVRVYYDGEVGWIAVVRYPKVDAGCSNLAGVSGGEKIEK